MAPVANNISETLLMLWHLWLTYLRHYSCCGTCGIHTEQLAFGHFKSSLKLLSSVYGSHTEEQYSSLGRTSAWYAWFVLIQFESPIRLCQIKESVRLFLVWSMCLFHFRSDCNVMARYLTESPDSRNMAMKIVVQIFWFTFGYNYDTNNITFSG